MTKISDAELSNKEDNPSERDLYWQGEHDSCVKFQDGTFINDMLVDPEGNLIDRQVYYAKYGFDKYQKECSRQDKIIKENRRKLGLITDEKQNVSTKQNKSINQYDSTKRMESGQHFPLFYEVLDNPEFRNGFMKKGKFRTYVWLGRYIVRGEMRNDPHRLYQNYYQKGLLASCVPTRVAARSLKIGKSTVSDHIKALSRDEIIERVTIPGSNSFDGQRYVVCVFGIHKNGKEHWFIQDRFRVSDN